MVVSKRKFTERAGTLAWDLLGNTTMNTLLVALALVTWTVWAAAMHIDMKKCKTKYPELAKRIDRAESKHTSVNDFLVEEEISDKDTCFFKCVMTEVGWFENGKFDTYAMLELLEDYMSSDQIEEEREYLSNIEGKHNCEKAYFIAKRLAEISEQYLN